MSVSQFSDELFFQILPTSGSDTLMGSFTGGTTTELKHILTWPIVVGTSGGTERFRLNLYPTAAMVSAQLMASSDFVEISSLAFASNGYNNLRFDFSRFNLDDAFTYFVGMETQNYTRPTNDSFYIGFEMDWPETVATTESGAMKMVVYGFR